MVSFVRISHLPFTEKPPIYRERVRRIEPDQKNQYGGENLQMVSTLSIWMFLLEPLEYL